MISYQCQLTTHGRRQLELDIKYPVTGKSKQKRYHLDLFVFTPYQLGMTYETYGVSRFLRDMRSYTRYSTYSIPLQKLADPACSISPITRISNILKETHMAKDIDEKTVLYELRVLACVYGRQLRDTKLIIRDFAHAKNPVADSIERLSVFLDDIDDFLEKFRSLHPKFLEPQVSDCLRQGLRWADESISLSTEKTLHDLYDLFGELPGSDDARLILKKRLGDEQAYRCALGYPTVAKPDDSATNEHFIYREGMLKKWADGCMFMTTETARITTHLTHILMGTAAGAAMIFAVIVTVFASRVFAMHSIPWAILIVVAYIAKDRIKELLRAILGACVPRLVADQVEDLIDPALGTKIGSSRARALFLHPNRLPDAVRRIRNIEKNVFQDIIPPENVIHFHKDIRLDSALLMQRHKRLESLTEIIRLKLDSWLANMDEPVNDLYHMENGRRIKISARRVYHLNLVVGISERNGEPADTQLVRHRLVLTRNGIVRIERVL